MVLTVSFTLSPVTGLFCHRRFVDLGVSARRADIASTKLDASVGASGPHDFAVRIGVARLRRRRVHRIPPNVRDDGQRPSFGRDGRSCRSDLPDGLSEIILQAGLDTQVIDLPVGQIN